MDRFTQPTPEATVVAVAADLVQDWGLDLAEPIGPATKVVADLDFASVDIIQLCVALEQSYDRKLGFQSLLMQDGSYVGDLTLAQFADHIAAQLDSQPSSPAP